MYEYTKWTCPGCGHQNPKGEKHCSMCPFDARQPVDATPEPPLKRHLDERRIARESTPAGCGERNQPKDVDGWPVRGCVSPAHD